MVALLDSAAVVAFLDHDDAFHVAADARIRELAGRDALIVSVITYAELLTGAGRGHHEQATVRGFFEQLIDEIADVDRRVAERAAEIRAGTPSLKMPDPLILATAEQHEVDLVVTADGRWPDVATDVRVEMLVAGDLPAG